MKSNYDIVIQQLKQFSLYDQHKQFICFQKDAILQTKN
jgi:hypothetical protein